MWTQQGTNENSKTQMQFMNTLSACVNKVIGEGYKECFKVTSRGLYATTTSRYYRPEQVQVVSLFRFEGNRDPADNAILYLIETSDGLKGTLVDAYGTYPDGSIGRFMAEVEDIRKKMGSYNQNFC
jgi:hypothetical protein